MNITAHGTINHPIEDVWVILSDFAGITNWHPGLLSCEADGNEVGAIRRVAFKDGRGATERLDVLDPNEHTLVYSVTESVRATVGVSGRVSLTAVSDNVTEVEWVVTLPPGIADDIVEGMRQYYPSRIQNLADAADRPAARR